MNGTFDNYCEEIWQAIGIIYATYEVEHIDYILEASEPFAIETAHQLEEVDLLPLAIDEFMVYNPALSEIELEFRMEIISYKQTN